MARVLSKSSRKRCRIILLASFCWILFTIFYYPLKEKAVRICCLIITNPKDIFTRARAIHETWGSHCDQHFFICENFSNVNITFEQVEYMQQLPLISVENISHGRVHLTKKVNVGFLHAYQYYLNDFDWFVKADDDSFIIIDNLRRLLVKHHPAEPVTFGYHFNQVIHNGYPSGGASYVLSREALKRWYRGHQIPKNSMCLWDGGMEDMEVNRCLRSEGVYVGNSRDEYDRERFHPLTFADLFTGNVPDWMLKFSAYPLRTHYNCCSDQTISFHYITPIEQYYLNFLLYRLHVERTKDKY